MGKIVFDINEEAVSQAAEGLRLIGKGLTAIAQGIEAFAAYDPDAEVIKYLAQALEAQPQESRARADGNTP
jgi:hypothetical protein